MQVWKLRGKGQGVSYGYSSLREYEVASFEGPEKCYQQWSHGGDSCTSVHDLKSRAVTVLIVPPCVTCTASPMKSTLVRETEW